MKKIISLLVTVFYVLMNLSAQNLEWNTQPQSISYLNAVLPNNDNGWILGGTAQGQNGGYYLVAIDSSGNSLWGNASTSFDEINSIDILEPDSDTSFYFINKAPPIINGDLITEGEFYFQRQHIDGRILSRTNFEWNDSFNEFKAFGILPNQNKLVIAQAQWSTFLDSRIVEISNTGEEIWVDNFDDYYLSDISLLENGGYLLASDKGVLKYDVNRVLEKIAIGNRDVLQIEKYGTAHFSAITASEIILLDTNLNIINNFSFDEVQFFSRHFTDGQNFYLTGKNNNDLPFVLKLDEDFNQQLYFTFGHSNVLPSQVTFHNGKIGVCGHVKKDPDFVNAEVNGLNGGSMFFKTFDETGYSKDYGKDVVITNIEVGSIEATPIVSDETIFNLRFSNVKITIENLGIDTLNELKVNYIDAPRTRKQEKLFNLRLPPGETITINLVPFEMRLEQLAEGEPFQLCLWTSVPDKKIDSNPVNDLFCKNIVIDLPEIATIDNVFIYPNPVRNDQVRFNLPLRSDLFGISISDVMGKVIYEKKANSSFSYILGVDVSDFSPGMYFLSLQLDKDFKSLPFVKL